MNRYEFCYLGVDRRPCFAIVYDDDVISACERILCRRVSGLDLSQTSNGTYFLRGWEPDETISVRETTAEASGTFALGEAKREPAPPVPPVDLGGLDLSQFAKQ